MIEKHVSNDSLLELELPVEGVIHTYNCKSGYLFTHYRHDVAGQSQLVM